MAVPAGVPGHPAVTRPLVSGRVVAVVGLLLAGWWFLAPPALGGQTTYIVTGASMSDYGPGGLVLVRPGAAYAVGDVVAHRNAEGRPTLGRIVDAADDRFLVRGDASPLTDASRPTTEAVLGTPWLHLPHGAEVLALLMTPLGFGASMVLLVAVALGIGRIGTAPPRPVRRPVTPLRP